jgi:Fe-S-cluster containining protein
MASGKADKSQTTVGHSRAAGAGKPKWYSEGLRFQCTQCGNCCSGPPGFVWTTAGEREAIARHLGLELADFMERYVRKVGQRYSLKETRNGRGLDCVFLIQQGSKRVCSIYSVRPMQCRTWPFWTDNLESPSAWADASRTCPGIGRGPRHEFVEIEIQRTRNF